MKSISLMMVFLLCALATVLLLTACGEKTDTPEATAAETTAVTESASPSAAETTPAETVAETVSDAEEAASDPALVGTWDYAELSGFMYTFNANGTGAYDLAGEVMEFTYEADGSTLKILYTDTGVDEPMELSYTIDGDTLTIKDSFGADTVYIRK